MNDGARRVHVLILKEVWDWVVGRNPGAILGGTLIDPHFDDYLDQFGDLVNEGRIVEVEMTFVRIVPSGTEIDVDSSARQERIVADPVRVFMIRTDWDFEAGRSDFMVYPSLASIRRSYGLKVAPGGIVEVEMTLVGIVRPGG